MCRKALLSMLIVVEQGGIAPGGNNFDCKLRRESTDIEDILCSCSCLFRLQAIASRLEAIASRLEAIASRSEAIASN